MAQTVSAAFADTAYWIAMFLPGDPWHRAARRASERLGKVRLVTADEVLAEFLTAVAAAGPVSRLRAVQFVRAILSNPAIEVHPQSRASLLRSMALYETRRDKRYSLTDCAAMAVMHSAGITKALTSDRHFEQEGFVALMRD